MVHADGRILLVAGQESHNQLFFVTPKVGQLPHSDITFVNAKTGRRESSSSSSAAAEIRQRKRTESTTSHDCNPLKTKQSSPQRESATTSPDMKRVYFNIKSGDSIQTDFSKSDPFQRVVRISPNGKLMATGGIDGHIRIWDFPRMTPIFDIKAHSSELDDIDLAPIVNLSFRWLKMVLRKFGLRVKR
jgi:prolactin regulatory element-binding protein